MSYLMLNYGLKDLSRIEDLFCCYAGVFMSLFHHYLSIFTVEVHS